MVLRNPPLAEPVKYPGGVKSKPPFEMGVANLIQIEGTSQVNNIELQMRDAMEITEEDIRIAAAETSHFIVIEMKKAAA